MRYACENCKYAFASDEEAVICPRCSSKRIRLIKGEEKKSVKAVVAKAPSGPMILGETKEAWTAFRAFEVKECRECGGTDFQLDFKKREKICKKCGALYPLKKYYWL